jgi:hypothetical protein
MKKIILVITVFLILFICVPFLKAEQSVYLIGGPSYGAFYTDDNFINVIIGYEIDFEEKLSISGEFQRSFRVTPDDGNLYALTSVIRYRFFGSEELDLYTLAGVGVSYHDFGNIHDGDVYGHRSRSDYLYHVVAGAGIEKRFDWLSFVTEIRYEHESNFNKYENFGCDKLVALIGIKFNLLKWRQNASKNYRRHKENGE